MRIVGAILGFLLHHPVFGLVVFGVLAVLFMAAVHSAPDKMQEKVDSRSAAKFKASRPAYLKAEKLRQIREEGRREDAVFKHHEPVKNKAQKLIDSRSPRRQRKGAELLKSYNWMVRKEMGVVHNVAKSSRVHHDGTIKRGIRRD